MREREKNKGRKVMCNNDIMILKVKLIFSLSNVNLLIKQTNYKKPCIANLFLFSKIKADVQSPTYVNVLIKITIMQMSMASTVTNDIKTCLP